MKTINRVDLQLCRLAWPEWLFALGLLLLGIATAMPAERPPNILIMVADDLGHADVGFHGLKEIPTPHLDALAAQGVRFSNAYVTGPYCSPTRAALLTGRYQQRFGHEFNPGGTNGLPLDQVTLADRLKSAGYQTGLVGKWHLGSTEKHHPLSRGFDEFFGFLGGAHSFTNLATNSNNPILRGRQPVAETEYLTDAFAREAEAFIDRHQNNPFFLYYALNAVHTPLETDAKHLDRVKHIADEKRRRFAALLVSLDDAVGRVTARLRERGLEERTLIFFFSDNGGPTSANTSLNTPLRGFKAQTWEGGVRVPFVAKWPGRLPAGKVYEQPVAQFDIPATALAAAGIAIKPEWRLDGVDLLPHLAGAKSQPPHEALFWRFGEQLAIRKGDWKLVKAAGGKALRGGDGGAPATTESAELYHLGKDISESNDLAAKHPEKFKELADDWDRWNAELIPPAWRGGGGGGSIVSNADQKGPWKKGDRLSSADAPKIAGRALQVSAKVEALGEGVIVAQGASGHGFSLYVREKKLGFALRVGGELTVVETPHALGQHQFVVQARLSRDGLVRLFIDGHQVAEGRAPGLIANQPADGLTVGEDGNGAVGEYNAPFGFTGEVNHVQVLAL